MNDPGGFLFLTQADTDLLALSKVVPRLGPEFPTVEAYNPSRLGGDEEVQEFLDRTLPDAEVIVLRLIGGPASFKPGLDQVVAHARSAQKTLLCLPGTDVLDPELTALSTAGVSVIHETFAYLQHGGLTNYEQMLRFLSDHLFATGFGFEAPELQPRHGIYHPDVPEGTLQAWRAHADPARPAAGILFYRSHLLSGNLDFIDALVREGEERGLNMLPVFAYSLKEYPEGEEARPGAFPSALRYFAPDSGIPVDVLISTMSFALGSIAGDAGDWSADVLSALGVPVLQAVAASTERDQWLASSRGLTPLDTAMNIAIPEFDGRIITVPVCFKEQITGAEGLGSTAVRYAPEPDRVARTIGQALRLTALRRIPNAEKRVVFVLTNYNSKVSRIANAVGLDSPASLLAILHAMGDADYDVGDLPPDGDELLRMLIERGSYDLEVLTEAQMAGAVARVPFGRYQEWFEELPENNRAAMVDRWGAPPGRFYVDDDGALVLAGLQFGNVFIAVQPPRGYGLDPTAIYHMPDLAPPHPYHALYRWLSTSLDGGGWGADAMVHVGKHGTLEWLPGKANGLSAECFPDLFLGDLPLVYPFIINNPGEGAQAKRRAHAVIVDHLTPPMTTAEGYGEIEQLARLVDEYYQLEQLDPSKLPLIQRQIWDLIKEAKLDEDLHLIHDHDHDHDDDDHHHDHDHHDSDEGLPGLIAHLSGREFAHLVEDLNGYLCELTSAQIRDGLHTLGVMPSGVQLIDTLFSLTRLPNLDVPSLRHGIARVYDIDPGALLDQPGARFDEPPTALAAVAGRALPTHADALEEIDALGQRLLTGLAEYEFRVHAIQDVIETVAGGKDSAEKWESVRQTLRFICAELVPRLERTREEIDHILDALDGRYIPAGPSGAPTRGMAHVLPTGRNFYAVDPRALPSVAAWEVGQQLADALLRRHLDDEGTYPHSVGISIWGTSAMRTHGDDIAEVFALLGVRPVWQAESRRVTGVEVISLEELGRPRVDVVCRISGFFRDAFPHLIALLDRAFLLVASLDEPNDMNFIRQHQEGERARMVAEGIPIEDAVHLAGYRVFGCKPGTYGAGILPLIDERNWQDAADFAEAYINWGGYAYTADEYGRDARGEFRQALGRVQVAVKNQDNREHDIFDSDDYLQYHGGMIATIRALAGRNPRRYFGDSADPTRPRVRDLKEEAQRVFRTRVVNPKWIKSIQRHGYKGALELAATVDYIFGYDATADVVDDWMYARVAEQYALDPQMQEFFRQSNPWALRDISGRLLEAAERGMWSNPGPLLDALQQAFLDTEAVLEGTAGTPSGGVQ